MPVVVFVERNLKEHAGGGVRNVPYVNNKCPM
jgi:hypothetical protein